MKLSKILAFALAALSLTSALAGCAPAAIPAAATAVPTGTAAAASSAAPSPAGSGQGLDPAHPVKITFYSYSLALPTMKDGMAHLIQSFNDTVGKEKGVVVEGVADTNFTKSTTDIQAGNQVDVVQQPFVNMDAARLAFGYKAFEDVFPADELKAHFAGIEQNALDLGKIDGKTYGMAFTFSTPITYINNTLFKQAGLDPANPPKTWDDVMTASIKIKEATGKYGLALAPANGWVTYGMFYSNGAEMFSQEGRAVFASPEGIAAIEMWKQFNTKGLLVPGTDSEAYQAFMAGNVGMAIGSTSMLSGTIKAFRQAGWELSEAGMPSFGSKPAIPVNSGSALCVRPDTDVKAKAAWEFVKYATGNEGYTIITSEIGYLPLRSAIVDDPKYLKPFADSQPVIRLNLEQLKTIRGTIWPAKISTEGSKLFTDAITKCVTANVDVAATLKQAQDDINKLYQ